MSSCRGTGSLTNNSRSLRPRSCGLQNTLTKVSLTSRLNLRQPFRILLQGMKHSYVSGDFYKLDLDLTDPNGPAKAVLSPITPISGLGTIVSQKGELQQGQRTEERSV